MQKIFLFVLVVSMLFACRKSDRDQDKTTKTSQDYATAQSMAQDVFKMVHQAAMSSQGIVANPLTSATTLFGCDTIIVDTTANPMWLKIQFNTDCANNGVTRNGEIKAEFTSKYDMLGSTVKISFNNYYYNGYYFEGVLNYSLTNNSNNQPVFVMIANDFKIDEGRKNRAIYFSTNQNFTIESGATTADFTDDIYKITGTATGRAFAGNSFSASTDGLTQLGNCNWVSNGTVLVTPQGLAVRNLDFGSGCDNIGTVLLYGATYEVTFP
ncbi:MAG TPA: hypothetical protein VIN73_10325 [Vicingaceae bacterium]